MALPRILTLVLCLLTPAVAYRLSGNGLFAGYALGYLVAAALSLYALHQDGELRAALTPRAGDPSFAVGGAAVLYFAVSALTLYVIAPLPLLRVCAVDGSWVAPPEPHGFTLVTEWVRDRACLAFAKTASLRGLPRGLAFLAIATLEELAWRGGVQTWLSEKLGTSRGWIAAALLFALAQLTTGNAAVALLALPVGLLLSALVRYRGTLFPAILAHAVFNWFFFYHNSPFLMRASGV